MRNKFIIFYVSKPLLNIPGTKTKGILRVMGFFSGLGVGISESRFIFDFAPLPLEVAWPI